MNRRIPPAQVGHSGSEAHLYFPSRVGFFFVLCLMLMLMTAINYENNLSYALTFLLATLFIVAVLHTYANLSGLTIRAVRAQPAFPGQQSDFEMLIERGKRRDHYALYMSWPDSSEGLVNLVEEDSVTVTLHLPVGERGWYNPGRLMLESTYPLGLLRCWTWIDLDLHALVYPRPLASQDLPGLASDHPTVRLCRSPAAMTFMAFAIIGWAIPCARCTGKGWPRARTCKASSMPRTLTAASGWIGRCFPVLVGSSACLTCVTGRWSLIGPTRSMVCACPGSVSSRPGESGTVMRCSRQLAVYERVSPHA